MPLAELEAKIQSMAYDVKANKALLDKSRTELQGLQEQMKVLEQAGETLKRIGEQKKKATIEMFERVVTMAVKEVFGFDYKFVIEVSAEKKVLTKFKLLQNDGLELDIMTSCGGGVVDVVAFVLKALMLASIRPQREPIMFLDESFSHVSSEYVPKVAMLLKSLSEQLNMRFLLVTHQHAFLEVATNGYSLVKTAKGTEFKKLI
ncbi:Uncharacterised protein [uncultured archaeon]|nr:Uncharacterised protein [uncultured archaeon]